MRRKNEVLDKINYIKDEVDRLHERTPEDTGDARFDLILRIVRGLKSQVEGLENLVELEEED
jgi:hypothetical protein